MAYSVHDLELWLPDLWPGAGEVGITAALLSHSLGWDEVTGWGPLQDAGLAGVSPLDVSQCLPSLVGDRMGGGAGHPPPPLGMEHYLPFSSPLGPFIQGLEIESAK